MSILNRIGKLFNKRAVTAYQKSFLCRRFGKPKITDETYTDSEWLFAAVSVIANSTAKIPVRLYKRERNGTEVEVVEHPVLDLLRMPNPDQTGNDLRVFTQQQEELRGIGYWYLGRGELTGEIREIWPLKTNLVTPKFDSAGKLIGYFVAAQGIDTTVNADDIIAFRQISPNSIYGGVAPAQAASRAVNADSNTLKYVEAFFENSARPDFIISGQGIDADAADDIKKKWNNEYEGVDRSNKVSVIDGELKFDKVSDGLKDLEITEQSREKRDRILGAFGVPKAVLGMVDDVNRANMEGSQLVFHEFVIGPRIQEYVEKLNTFLLPKLRKTENLFFRADEHIPEDIEQRRKNLDSGVVNGYITANEARQELGYSPVDGGDTLFVSLGRVPIEEAANPAVEPAAKSLEKSFVDSEEEYLRVHSKQERKFIGVVTDLFEKQRKAAKSGLTKGFKKDGDFNPLDGQYWLREFVEASTPLYFSSVEAGGDLGAAEVASAAAAGTQVAFSERSPFILAEVSRMATYFATQLNETTAKELQQSLAEGLSLGESEGVLADRVDDVFNRRVNNATTIARTETTKAINFGQIESYRQSGIAKKQWLTVLDERTRAGHMEANMQVRGLDEPFNVAGESLRTPGDTNGSAENTINCRCRVLPVIN